MSLNALTNPPTSRPPGAGARASRLAAVLLAALALGATAHAADKPNPAPVREDLGIFNYANCRNDPYSCSSHGPHIQIGPIRLRLQGDVTVDDQGVEGLLAEPGKDGVLWFVVSSEVEDAGSVNVSITLDESPNVTWEKSLYQATFPTRGGSSDASARNATIEDEIKFEIPQGAKPGRVPVPFTLRVGNETLHAAFFMNVVESFETGARPGETPPEGTTPPTMAPMGGVALVALAAALAALAVGVRMRRRGRGGGR